ncbi:tripartite motif-containing protein 2-like [Littorina saxatilis]|uniref:Uncharacterized protein n=1 Tax=Littorina saxatilis TaxID=31220 RepID=A0AAN9AIF6_9CAEN
MAMASRPSLPDGDKRFTDCPHCGLLCLGSTILPCGHVTCRKCLRDMLHKKKACSTCKHSLPVQTEQTVSQLTQLFSAEPVLHDLVNQRLQDLGQQSCHACQNRDATMICQDCREMYCDACSAAHKKMGMSSDHAQQPLPHTLCNAPLGAHSTKDATIRPQSQTSTRSEDSITNLPRTDPSQSKQDRDTMKREIQLLQKAASDVKEVAQVAKNVSILAQKLAEDAEGKEQIINIYTARLLKADMKNGKSGHTYVSGLGHGDITADVKMQDLQRRLRDVRRICHQFHDMDKLQSESARLIQKADKSSHPMTATPRHVFETTAVTDQDTKTPYINDLLTTPDGRLLMADYYNKMIKVVARPLSGEHTLPALTLEKDPRYMSLLSDGLVAVTAWGKTIYLVDVSSHVTVKTKFKTKRQYQGVTDGPDDDTLLVSRWKDEGGPAGVDVIKRNGSLVRTVIDGTKLEGLEMQYSICVVDGHVLIPDFSQHCVYRVEVTSGRLVDTLTHPDLKGPTQVVADDDGKLYIVCEQSHSVVVWSCEGEWRRLLQHGSGDNSYPVAMCLTKSGITVGWVNKKGRTVLFDKVIAYELVQ